MIADREIELVHELQIQVLRYDILLNNCAETCAELDWYVDIFGSRLLQAEGREQSVGYGRGRREVQVCKAPFERRKCDQNY
jgi:hypothetical protein